MSFFDWIKDKFGLFDEDDYEFEIPIREGDDAQSVTEALRRQSTSRRDLNIHNPIERERYIRGLCEQMASNSGDVDGKKSEYQKVTDKLQDIEEIEALPDSDREMLRYCAKNILNLEEEEAQYKRPNSKITEHQYHEMEKIEGDVEEILRKIEDSEKYQAVVRRDMNLLEGEKAALAYQRKEDKNRINNAKSLFFVFVFAAVLAYIVIIALGVTMRINMLLPISIVSAMLAVALTFIFVNFRDAREDLLRTSRQINKSITLQNAAKIKYVNVTNLIDYYYAKYKINSSHELYYLYEKYAEEKKSRHHSEDAAARFESLRLELFNLIKRYRIKDPAFWVYEPRVLVYDRELADLRHDLVVQRQRLRKGIDFEVYNLENGEKEIKDIVMQYPQYSKEIMAIVDQYE